MIPKYYEMYNVFLEILSDGKVHSLKEIQKSVVKEMNITHEEQEEKLPSGKGTFFRNRVGWCSTYLKKAGLIVSPKRAEFQITREGIMLLSEGVVITDEVLMKYPSFSLFKKVRSSVKDEQLRERGETPQDTLDRVLGQIREKLIDDLLEEVMNQSPEFFERMVIDLLEKMGYGGIGEGYVTKYTGDEGIDGVIKEDKLGFEHIYIQAKKWNSNKKVGRPEIQKFVGALVGQGAAKGLFITTASFTKEAIEYAKRQHTAKVILIDSEKLAELLIEYGVGVSVVNEYKVKRVDMDYFTDDM
ncbi:restriction endonuclease [Filifactor villosus]|uniref:Restriction endonuclease n=1 Tax=Filifactor villosus TaxID=29374 RepID=A0ABV9QHC6_9FIRM